jgi:hydrogenase expression/formation protein HypE
VIQSIREAARRCRVQVVTGDTKVVPRGAADGLFVNTTGIGRLRDGIDLGARRVRPGDRVLVSGTIGDHGIAVLCVREQLGFESDLQSDTAALHDLVQPLFDAGIDVHFMRDPTRGGVSAVLHELAEAAGVSVVLDEAALPVSQPVRGACELLGLDPLHVANEGKVVAIVPPDATDSVLECLKRHPLGAAAAIIGEVVETSTSPVFVRGALGSSRVLDEPSGAPLPRIC